MHYSALITCSLSYSRHILAWQNIVIARASIPRHTLSTLPHHEAEVFVFGCEGEWVVYVIPGGG
jgi:hypothetical protein